MRLAGALAGFEGGEDWALVILDTFLTLSKQRGRTQGGACPITFNDIKAYLELNSLKLHPVELDMLISLDEVFMSTISEIIQEHIEQAKKQGA